MATSTSNLMKNEVYRRIENEVSSISERVLQLVSYFDSFDYPIWLNELLALLDVEEGEIRDALISLIEGDKISNKNGFLAGIIGF